MTSRLSFDRARCHAAREVPELDEEALVGEGFLGRRDRPVDPVPKSSAQRRKRAVADSCSTLGTAGDRGRRIAASRASGSAECRRTIASSIEASTRWATATVGSAEGATSWATASAAARSKPSGNTAKRAEEPLLVLGEEVVGPLDRGPQAAVAFVARPRVAAEDVERAVQPRAEVLHAERREPTGGQLDGQRNAVQPAHHASRWRRRRQRPARSRFAPAWPARGTPPPTGRSRCRLADRAPARGSGATRQHLFEAAGRAAPDWWRRSSARCSVSARVASSWRTEVRRCSQLSSTTSHGRDPSRTQPPRADRRCRRAGRARREHVRQRRLVGDSGETHHATSRPVRSRRAASSARCVLPTPSGPTRLTRRSDCQRRAIPASSASRPIS